MAHTPGPWKATGPLSSIHTESDPYGRGQMHVADVRGWGHLTGRGGGCAFDEEKAIGIQSANARLIAAAPDLLEALKACAFRLGVLVLAQGAFDQANADAIDQANAAIAKAGS